MKKRNLVSLLLAVFTVLSVLPFCAVYAAADAPELPENCFSDVQEKSWYEESVLYCYKYAYVSGTGEAAFSPSVRMNRAMFVTILYNIDGASEKYSGSSFADVKADSWYANPVEWAFDNGYASGTGSDERGLFFSPLAPVTRETLTVFLRTYADAKGFDVSERADLSVYSDAGDVHSWAGDAVSWAVACGIISGVKDKELSPRTPATRAQIAVILRNFTEKFPVHVWENESVEAVRTCTQPGISVFTCSDCGRTRTVEYQPWHIYGEAVITKAPTCTDAGEKTSSCRKCGATKTEPVPKSAHVFVNGICEYCNAVSGANALLVGSWKASVMVDSADNTYTLDSNAFFNANGTASISVAGKLFDFKWVYTGVIENGLVQFHIWNSVEEYYLYVGIDPAQESLFRCMIMDLTANTVFYTR